MIITITICVVNLKSCQFHCHQFNADVNEAGQIECKYCKQHSLKIL